MIDSNGYNYNEFLSDSSDDYPKYADGLSQEQLDGIPFHYKPANNLIALENVLSLAEEQCKFLYSNISEQTGLSADQVVADDSILTVKEMLNMMKAGVDSKTTEASNIALAQDTDNG